MTDNDLINILDPFYHLSTKSFKTQLLSQSRTDTNKNIKTKHPLRNKMNENLFTSFITPVILGLPLVTLIVLFPSLLFPTSNRLVSNRFVTLQQWILQLVSKQIMSIHNSKGQTWTLILISLILFIGSINLGIAIPLWAGAVITGFRNKTKASLAHFLPQGTPTPLIPILVIIETISLFIQPIALAVRLTANITAGHLLIHLIGGATLALISISTTTALITFTILILLTILEFAVAIIQAYVFTLLVSLYLHDNT